MSIATDEADKRYPFNKEASSDDELLLNDDNGLKNEGYIAGRTSEPTEAEIKAAIAAYMIHNMDFTHCDPPQPCACGLEFPSKLSRAEHVFGEILKAARKAVAE